MKTVAKILTVLGALAFFAGTYTFYSLPGAVGVLGWSRLYSGLIAMGLGAFLIVIGCLIAVRGRFERPWLIFVPFADPRPKYWFSKTEPKRSTPIGPRLVN